MIHIASHSLVTTIQDLGRVGYQKYGINVSGAMDPLSLRAANLLVGNEEGAGAIEMTLIGPDMTFEEDTLLALTGADLSPNIKGIPVPMYRPVAVKAGTVLSFGRPRLGVRGYMAVAGGFTVPSVMGSQSTYARAGIGGFEGRPIRAGDSVPTGEPSSKVKKYMKSLLEGKSFGWPSWFAGNFYMNEKSLREPVRYTEGLQYDHFTEKSHQLLNEGHYIVTANSDRMGYRLSGPKLGLTSPLEMISEMCALGTIQVPPEGNPIILMAEHQSCAGYPEIGQAALVDIGRIAQKGPKDTICFKKISREEAEDEFIFMEKKMREIREGISYRTGWGE
ncbi:biotin-dependent carboxyltransferase family protein [uncultured Dialister sp.]|jgi:antagonist of KipI|uniref:5-oxoprolinase subunit C family protein n=1 Tax=uncultured Dialister sp. TaxID=278064 RepID=UPI0025E6CAC0|nr:biotin-dependent carboxyltransferase family protein [uncultured Dialister sp.]